MAIITDLAAEVSPFLNHYHDIPITPACVDTPTMNERTVMLPHFKVLTRLLLDHCGFSQLS
jgi:hypothetical protein